MLFKGLIDKMTMKIGNVQFDGNLILSPMAGFSNLPFRIMARKYGAALVCTEMVHVQAYANDAPPALQRAVTAEKEKPVCIQLFGTEPEHIAPIAKELGEQCDILGFNFGCPAWQIRKSGCGAALLDEPEKMIEIVKAIKKASNTPLLVKMRAGNEKLADIKKLGKQLEDAGADGIIFHARTAKQGYSGKADWKLIRELKQHIRIPVIANGDVINGKSAKQCLDETNADGIAIGRASLGDPYVFRRISEYLKNGKEIPELSAKEKIKLFGEYAVLAEQCKIPFQDIINQAVYFTKGIQGAAKLRQEIVKAKTISDLIKTMDNFKIQ